MCEHCENATNGVVEGLDDLASNEERSTYLCRCPRCGALWMGHGFNPQIMMELSQDEASDNFPTHSIGSHPMMNANSTPTIVIPLSKGKIALLLLGCAAFVAGGVWMWSIADAPSRFHPLFLRAVAVLSVLFFGFCGIYGCVKIFDGRPGLIIDEEGIIDHSSAVAAGRVHWDEVTGFRVSEIMGQRFLAIEVVDPQKHLAKSGLFRRTLNSWNTQIAGSPINISSNSLKVDFDEMVRMLTTAFEQHKALSRAKRDA